MSFIKFFIRWVASNLSVPFWVVGHIHLSINVYKDLHEILMSLGMNIVVGFGFWMEWKEFTKQNSHHNHKS